MPTPFQSTLPKVKFPMPYAVVNGIPVPQSGTAGLLNHSQSAGIPAPVGLPGYASPTPAGPIDWLAPENLRKPIPMGTPLTGLPGWRIAGFGSQAELDAADLAEKTASRQNAEARAAYDRALADRTGIYGQIFAPGGAAGAALGHLGPIGSKPIGPTTAPTNTGPATPNAPWFQSPWNQPQQKELAYWQRGLPQYA